MTKFKVEKKSSKASSFIPLNEKSTKIKKTEKSKFVKARANDLYEYCKTNERENESSRKKAEFKKEALCVISSNKFEKSSKEADYREIFSNLWIKYKPRSTTYIKSGIDWVSQLMDETQEDKPIPLFIRKRLKELAEQIYEDDLRANKQAQVNRNKSERYFHKAVSSHGTTRDKIASHALQCMDSPVFSLSNLHFLIECVSPKAKYNRVEAIDHLINLFLSTYLANDHVAKEFECHNFTSLIPLIKSNAEQIEKQLVLWHFEDQVRLAYLKFIENLDAVSHDTQLTSKLQGIKGLESLIKNHPNQDSEVILRKLINKFGDSSKKICGGIAKILSSFQIYQPHLKLTLVSLVEELLYRPNVSFKTQYYGLCFLKDIIFERGDQKMPQKLIKLYFDFFQTCSKSGEVDSRFMSALLRGLNRAYPFLKDGSSFLEEQISTLYTLCHVVPFNIATQALQLIYQVQINNHSEINDRFHSLLYSLLLDPSYGKSSANGAFLNVVFKTMCRDNNFSRVCAFIRRLLQTSKYLPSHVACGVLFLISEVIKDNSVITSIEAILRTNEQINFKTAKMSFESDIDGNSSSSDVEIDQEGIDVKSNQQEGSFISSKTNSTKKSSTSSRTSSKGSITTPSSDASSSRINTSANSPTIKNELSLHGENYKKPFKAHEVHVDHYEPTIRNPSFCGADLSPIWELHELTAHYHPTVSLFASTLLMSRHVSYSGDPLEDFTLTRFLDRFIHRNPKKAIPGHDKIGNILGSRRQYIPSGVRKLSVLSEQFRLLKKEKVAAEDVFCHNYFTTYRKTQDNVKAKSEDESSVDDDEFEEYLQRMAQVENEDDDDWEDDLDFAQDIAANKDKKDVSLSEENDEDMSQDDEELEDNWGATDEENDSDNEEEELDNWQEDLDESQEGLDELCGYSDEDEDNSFSVKGRNKKVKPHKQANKSNEWMGMEADLDDEDADEFNQLLENEVENDPYAGTSEAVSNPRKSHTKQLAWEKNRRQGFNKTKTSSGKTSFKSKKVFGKMKKRN